MNDATPIEDLDLTVRTYNGLRHEGIRTLEELTTRTRRNLLDIRNFGAKSLDEITEKLQARGLRLAAEDDPGRWHGTQPEYSFSPYSLRPPQKGNDMTQVKFSGYDRLGREFGLEIERRPLFGLDMIEVWTDGTDNTVHSYDTDDQHNYLFLTIDKARDLAEILLSLASEQAGEQAGEAT